LSGVAWRSVVGATGAPHAPGDGCARLALTRAARARTRPRGRGVLPQGKLRVTIQGETIEQQFGEREVCFR
jgi:hypothetical protein